MVSQGKARRIESVRSGEDHTFVVHRGKSQRFYHNVSFASRVRMCWLSKKLVMEELFWLFLTSYGWEIDERVYY